MDGLLTQCVGWARARAWLLKIEGYTNVAFWSLAVICETGVQGHKKTFSKPFFLLLTHPTYDCIKVPPLKIFMKFWVSCYKKFEQFFPLPKIEFSSRFASPFFGTGCVCPRSRTPILIFLSPFFTRGIANHHFSTKTQVPLANPNKQGSYRILLLKSLEGRRILHHSSKRQQL